MAPRKSTSAAAKSTGTRTARKAAPAAEPTPAKKPVGRPRKAAAVPAQSTAELAANAAVADALTGGGDFTAFLTDLKALADRYLSGATASAPATATAVDTAPTAPQTRDEREEELLGWSVRQLQAALIAAEYDPKEIKAEKDVEVLVANLLDHEFPTDSDDLDDDEDADDDSEDDADDDDDEEEGDEEDEEDSDDADDEDDDDDDTDDEDDEEVTRESLMSHSLAEMRKLAVNVYDIDAAQVRGKDKDTIADLIMETFGEGDDDEDTDGAGEGEEEYWTKAELDALGIAELRGIADDAGIGYTKTTAKAALIKKILA